MGWCSKTWGGAPKSCPRMGWCSKVGVVLSQNRVVFQKMGWCSKKLSQNPPRLDGVVFQKLGWCSKRLSKNPALYTTDILLQKIKKMLELNQSESCRLMQKSLLLTSCSLSIQASICLLKASLRLMSKMSESFSVIPRGGRVVRRCWVNFQC